RHRLQEFAIRQLRQPLRLPRDTGELFHVGVPRRDVLVADRPIDAVAVPRVRFKVEIAPAIALPAPQHRASTQDVAAHPVERFLLVHDVRVETIVVPELPVLFFKPTEAALDGVVALVNLPVAVVAELVAPGRLVLALVVAYVLDLPPALEYQRLQSFFGQFLCRPASGYPGANDNRVEVR